MSRRIFVVSLFSVGGPFFLILPHMYVFYEWSRGKEEDVDYYLEALAHLRAKCIDDLFSFDMLDVYIYVYAYAYAAPARYNAWTDFTGRDARVWAEKARGGSGNEASKFAVIFRRDVRQ